MDRSILVTLSSNADNSRFRSSIDPAAVTTKTLYNSEYQHSDKEKRDVSELYMITHIIYKIKMSV